MATRRTTGEQLNGGHDVRVQSLRSINRFCSEFAEELIAKEMEKPNSEVKLPPEMLGSLVALSEVGSDHHDEVVRHPQVDELIGAPANRSKPLFANNAHTKTVLNEKTLTSPSVPGEAVFIRSNNLLQLLPPGEDDNNKEADKVATLSSSTSLTPAAAAMADAQSSAIYVTSLTTSTSTCEDALVPPKMSNHSRKCSIIFLGRDQCDV